VTAVDNPIGSNYSFEHLLTRDASYAALLASNRRMLHSLTADALQQRIVPGNPDELALAEQRLWHLQHAERWQAAHSCCCTVMQLRTMLGATSGWEQLAAQAARFWQLAREQDPSLPQRSAAEVNIWSYYSSVHGMISEGRQLAFEAAELARQAGNDEQLAFAFNNVGIAMISGGDFEEAIKHFKEALTYFRQLEIQRGVLRALNNIGLALSNLNRFEEARIHLEKAEQIATELADELMICNVSLNLGVLLDDINETEAAEQKWSRAMEIAHRMGDLQTEATTMVNLGAVALRDGKTARGEQLLWQALRQGKQIGVPMICAVALCRLGESAVNAMRYAQARELLLEAMQIAESISDPSRCIDSAVLLARLEENLGNHPAAGSYATKALSIGQSMGYDGHPVFSKAIEGIRHLLTSSVQVGEAQNLEDA
jgi:tetratricopeptide (TPR) repeat protein